MCDCYRDPYYLNLAKLALSPQGVNYGFSKAYQQSSPGMFMGLQLYSNETSWGRMDHGCKGPHPYKGGIKAFASDMISEIPALQNQVNRCSLQTDNMIGCQLGAVSFLNNKFRRQNVTGAPEGMWYVPPSGSGSCHP
uniref:Uncharacterized protein n=1 Tax=Marseillevirus LCMAC101 TaxID=2506602 RepID=A0A481YTY6_9VIRU|nr:MAG: hypothetical protein LCMAC101_05790 [Marseillevirus LCMAC101]